MAIDQSTLTKGEIRKLNALRKSIGDDLADGAFSKWLKQQAKVSKAPKADAVAERIAEALKPYDRDKSFNLGRYSILFVWHDDLPSAELEARYGSHASAVRATFANFGSS